MRKKNVAYLRVSTEAQAEKYGLDVQRQKIEEYCEKNGVKIDKWYIDGGYSGSSIERPDMQALLDDSERGLIGTVYIYKLDRMSRDVIDTLNLLHRILPKYGVKVISMTEDLRFENPMDKVMIGVNAIMGQYEREVIYMRTRAGMKERVKKGLWPGGGMVPWGYYYDRNDGILHPDPEQAEMVRKAYEMYVDGYSCQKIAKILGFKGEPIVLNILKRKSNIGLIEYNGEVYQGRHEPIVSEDLFYKAQECMKRRSTNSHIANDHMLTGLCFCGVCGARMRYQKWGKYHKIICYSQQLSKEYMVKDPNCNNDKVIAKRIEREVEEQFKKFATNIRGGKRQESKREIIESAIQKSNNKIKRLYHLYAESDSDNLLEVIQAEEEKLKGLKKDLQLEDEKNQAEKNMHSSLGEVKKIADVWDMLDGMEKNKVLKKCIQKIIINKGDIDIYFKF